MPKNKDDLGGFLDQARSEYHESLPEKLGVLEQYIALLQKDPGNHDLQRKMFDIVHRISGSAGSFGLDDIGNVADEWERTLRALRPASASDYAGMRGYIARIRSLL